MRSIITEIFPHDTPRTWGQQLQSKVQAVYHSIYPSSSLSFKIFFFSYILLPLFTIYLCALTLSAHIWMCWKVNVIMKFISNLIMCIILYYIMNNNLYELRPELYCNNYFLTHLNEYKKNWSRKITEGGSIISVPFPFSSGQNGFKQQGIDVTQLMSGPIF